MLSSSQPSVNFSSPKKHLMPSSGLYWNCTCAYLSTDIQLCRSLIKKTIDLLKYNEHGNTLKVSCEVQCVQKAWIWGYFQGLQKKKKKKLKKHVHTIFIFVFDLQFFSLFLYNIWLLPCPPPPNVECHCRRARITLFLVVAPKVSKEI